MDKDTIRTMKRINDNSYYGINPNLTPKYLYYCENCNKWYYKFNTSTVERCPYCNKEIK